MAVEALSGMFEKPVEELADSKLKVDIMDKTTYCNKRRVILLEDTAQNLAEGKSTAYLDPLYVTNSCCLGRWTFNVELTGSTGSGR
jgi:ariadne-1